MMEPEHGVGCDGDYWLGPAKKLQQDLQEALSFWGIEIDSEYFELIGFNRAPNPSESRERLSAGTSEDAPLNHSREIAISSEEIRAVVLEMDQRLKGEWKTSQQDELLQSRAQISFSMLSHGTAHLGMRPGAEFSRQYSDFLDR